MVNGRETRTIPESAVVLAGARDFDPLERLRLDSSSVHHLPPAAIDSDDAVARAVDAMEPAADGALSPPGPRRARLRGGAGEHLQRPRRPQRRPAHHAGPLAARHPPGASGFAHRLRPGVRLRGTGAADRNGLARGRRRARRAEPDEGARPARQPGGGRRRGGAGGPDRARDAGPARGLAGGHRGRGRPARREGAGAADLRRRRGPDERAARATARSSASASSRSTATRRKGTRPSYVRAAPAEEAEPLYDRFCERAGAKKGVFGACMGVALVNDGPVTVMLEV